MVAEHRVRTVAVRLPTLVVGSTRYKGGSQKRTVHTESAIQPRHASWGSLGKSSEVETAGCTGSCGCCPFGKLEAYQSRQKAGRVL